VTGHVVILPLAEKRDDEVASELPSQNLSEEINIGNEGALEDNWDVGSVEELDGVWLSETSHFAAAQAQLNAESLKARSNLKLN
jgi:hypothetical protein